MRLRYQDKIYKLCQEVRNALDSVARHVGPISFHICGDLFVYLTINSGLY